jgi:hypothetical protein
MKRFQTLLSIYISAAISRGEDWLRHDERPECATGFFAGFREGPPASVRDEGNGNVTLDELTLSATAAAAAAAAAAPDAAAVSTLLADANVRHGALLAGGH